MRRRVKVLICGSTQGNYGGIEAVMLAMADALRTQPGWEGHLALKLVAGAKIGESLATRLSESDLRWEVVGRMGGRLLGLIRECDVVHVQNVPPDIVGMARFLGKPVISTTHNYRQPRWGMHRMLWDLGNRLCERVTYNSAFVCRTWNPGGWIPRSHEVIPTLCGLPSAQCPGGGRKGFAFISRWIPNKGVNLLLEAWESARINHEEWPLVMMGDGPLRPEIEQRVRDRNVPGLLITGAVSEAEKNARLAGARWVVVPPNTREDMGLVPIEARNLGTPVIASRDGGLPESAGRDALFFAPGQVDDLRACLEAAASMKENDYLERAVRAQESLRSYLRPMTVYQERYQSILQFCPGRTPSLLM